MKKSILLINSRGFSKDIVYFPLGLGYIASACHNEGIETECLDLNVQSMDNFRVIDKILKGDFHIVGIGGFLMQLMSTIELTNAIKEKCRDVKVILGGTQVFGCEEFIMENSKADIICRGESEVTLPEIVHLLYMNKDLAEVPSITYRLNGEVLRTGGHSFVSDLDKISFPKYDAFQMESYIKGNYHCTPGRRTIDMICSRGCPYKCTYCINSKQRTRVRYRSPDNIVEEIRILKEAYMINDFAFGDEIFTVNKKKSIAICSAIKDEKITWVTSCRADGIDDELLSAMKASGCRMVLIGFESGSEKILRSMNKRVSIGTYTDAIKLLRKHGMSFYSNFMIGMPDEKRDTIRETEKFCIENKLIFGGSYVTPFPGTKLYDNVKHKITDEKKYFTSIGKMNFSKEPILNLTEMTEKEMVSLRNNAVINSICSIIHDKLWFIPMFIIKVTCKSYLSLFNVNNPLISKWLRPINKMIYRVQGKTFG